LVLGIVGGALRGFWSGLGASISEGVELVIIVGGSVGGIGTGASERLPVGEHVGISLISGILLEGEITSELQDMFAVIDFGVGGIFLQLGTVSARVLRIPFNAKKGIFVENHFLIANSIAASGIVFRIEATLVVVAVI